MKASVILTVSLCLILVRAAAQPLSNNLNVLDPAIEAKIDALIGGLK